MIRQAVILCGGMGTRLGSLARTTPKPLLLVTDRPFLDVVLFDLARHGIRKILLLAGFLADRFVDYAATTPLRNQFDLEINVSVESEPSGTGGALWHACDQLDPDFLLLNGDSWFDINLVDLGRQLISEHSATGVMALRAVPDAVRYGTVETVGNHIVRFADRPLRSGPGIVNAGIYALRRSIVERLSPRCSLERDVFPAVAAAGRLLGFLSHRYFIDIGIPDDLARGRCEIWRQQQRPAAFLTRDSVLIRDDHPIGTLARARWIDGAKDALKLLNDSGLFVFVVRNQEGARNPFSENDLSAFDAHLADELAAVGAHVDAFYDRPPEMILDLMARWPIDPSQSFLIGNSCSDLAAARAAALQGYLVRGDDLRSVMVNCIGLGRVQPAGCAATLARNQR